MKTPFFNNDETFTNNNMLSTQASHFIANLLVQLNYHFPEDGMIVSSISNDAISSMESATLSDGSRNDKFYQTKLVHDSDNDLYRVNESGKYKALQTKLDSNFDSGTAFVNPSTGQLTTEGLAFFAQLVEETS